MLEKELSKQKHLEIKCPEDDTTVSLGQDWSMCDLNLLLERCLYRGIYRRRMVGRFYKFQSMIGK